MTCRVSLVAAVLAVPASILIAPALPSQEAAPAAAAPDGNALLSRACKKMQSLAGVKFRTIELQDSAMMRSMPAALRDRMGAGDLEVEGTWCNGVLHANVNVDEDEIVVHGGRTVARSGGPWKLRRDTLVSGGSIPFLFDPQLFFEVVGNLPKTDFKVAHAEPGRYRGKDLQLLSITLEGRVAGELQLAGVFPKASGPNPGRMLGLGGGGASDPTEGATVDLALYVDAETALVHRVRVKAYKKSRSAAGFAFQVAGGGFGGEEEEEKEVEEKDKDGKRIYKRGLPVRNLGKDLSLADFDIALADHGKTFTVELDETARRLLKLRKDR